ncbi:MAG: RNA polymerase sigma factor (sigma-70 family) [Verrucomicrobiales bacterium]|jgi:RNA polymerase sigma factor (sigma-70 family)
MNRHAPRQKGDDADAAEMARLQRGDESALHAIMERWEKSVLSFIYRYVNNWSVAVDLAQETFVKVYQSRARYKPRAAFSSWLFAIAVNLCRSHRRWERRHPRGGFEESERALADEADEDTTPDDSADRDDRARIVRKAIGDLPHSLRVVILLFEFEGLSHREIAQALSCSEKAIETRLYRARKRLRETLEEQLG